MRTMFLLIWLLGTLLATTVCWLLSDFLIRPLKRVTRIIGEINDNTYTQNVTFRYQDEIGLLGNQINTMYSTIQKQMKHIKLEEREKARLEIQMLSEQINPHFLYNTLERIHLTMLSGRSKNASDMLEGLGKYLRITLSIGKSSISLKDEITHVTQYMQLMGRCLESGFRYTLDIDESLFNELIPKIILQPLVENSLKYGFDNAPLSGASLMPMIAITAKRKEAFMHLIVSDNGKGFNPDQMQAITAGQKEGPRSHFGLYNIASRLYRSYGDTAHITFASIPYYENSVCICIPLSHPDE